jgi:indole-3-glycerol phosphate synthase
MPIVRLRKKMPSVNKPVLMLTKIVLEEAELAEASVAAADLVAVIWAGLDVNLLKAFK